MVACQAPLSIRFSRQEYWSGLSFPSPGIIWTIREAHVIGFFLGGEIITLQYCDDFLPYINMNRPSAPPSWPHLPPHPIHLGCHRALALGSLRHTANSHWLSVLHMAMCVFHCYSLKSSHFLFPPLFPKVCSLCLYLLCCHHIELSVLSFWIPYICVNSQYLSFSFWLKSLNCVWLFVTS